MRDAEQVLDPHTGAWNIQVWVSWIVSTCATLGGAYLLPVDPWQKGYLLLGILFMLGSSFALAKTVRDNHEAKRMRNRLTRAKADKLLKEFEMADAS